MIIIQHVVHIVGENDFIACIEIRLINRYI